MQDRRPLKILDASAGSGKTFALVNHYLVYALASPRPQKVREVVAITFTNAAALELREKIIQAIEELLGIKPGRPEERIVELKKLRVNADWELRLRALYEHLLLFYDDLRVGTIDSFILKISKMFEKEMHLDADAGMTLQSNAIIEQAVEKLLAEEEPDVYNLLMEFALDKFGEGKSTNLWSDLLGTGNAVLAEGRDAGASMTIEEVGELQRRVRSWLERVRGFWSDKAVEIDDLFRRQGYDLATDTSRKMLTGFLGKLVDSKANLPDYYEPSKFLEIQGVFTKDFIKKNAGADSFYEGILAPLLSDLVQHYKSHWHTAKIATLLDKALYKKGIEDYLYGLIKSQQEQQRIYLLSEIKNRVEALLASGETNHLFLKLGEQIRHLLIDEFQDTSTQQWNILRPFVENSISQGYECLLVGDPKQSIYGFRGGNVDLMIKQVPEEFSAFVNSSEVLDTNYRSSERIVAYNNALVEKLQIQQELAPKLATAYKNRVQKARKNAPVGEPVVSKVYLDIKNKEDLREMSINPFLEEQLNAILEVDGKLDDVCFLVRKSEEERWVTKWLMDWRREMGLTASELPISSLRASVSQADMACRCIWEGLILSTLPQDKLEKEGRLLLIMLRDGLGKTLEHSKLQDIIAVANDAPSWWERGMILQELLEMTNSKTMQRFMDFLLANEGLTWTLLEQTYEEKELSLYEHRDKRGIKVTTVHKSKGLQFDTVVVPILDRLMKLSYHLHNVQVREEFLPREWGTKEGTVYSLPATLSMLESPIQVEYARALEEEVTNETNLIYVALTRAMRRLVVGYQEAWSEVLGDMESQAMG